MDPILLVLIVLALVGEAYLFFALRRVLPEDEEEHSALSGPRAPAELEAAVGDLIAELERTADRINQDLEKRIATLKNLLADADNRTGGVAEMGREAPAAPAESAKELGPPAAEAPAGRPAEGQRQERSAREWPQVNSVQELAAHILKNGALPPAGGRQQGRDERPTDRAGGEEAQSAHLVAEKGPASVAGKRRLVFEMAKRGASRAEIARRTNLAQGEIELLLQLRKQGRE